MHQWITPDGLRVADIGCGGGIYAKAWLDLGAAEVVGIGRHFGCSCQAAS